MKKRGWIAITIVLLDQLIKSYVRSCPQGEPFFEICGLFSLVHCTNTGAAFSLLTGRTMLLTLLSAALLSAIVAYASRQMNLSEAGWIALEGIVGGGVGNLLDRLIFSGVTDYIHLLFWDFPVFNLADAAITCSAAALMVLLVTDKLEAAVEGKHGSDT